MKASNYTATNLTAVLLFCAMGFLAHQAVFAQTGVYFDKSASLTEFNDPVIEFSVSGEKLADLKTTIWLEFGSDNPGATLPLPSPAVSFRLQNILPSDVFTGCGPTGPTATSLTLIDGLDDERMWNPNKRIQFNDEDMTATATPRGVFKLTITHKDDLTSPDGYGIPPGATETWRICISNLPAGAAPQTRLIASMQDPDGQFTNLEPLAPSCPPCTGSTPNIYTTVSVSGYTFTANTVTENGDPLPAGTTIVAVAEDFPATPGGGSFMPTGAQPANTPLVVSYTPPGGSLSCHNLVTFRFDVKDASNALIAQTRISKELVGSCGGVILPPVVVGRVPVFVGELCPEFPPIGPGPGPCPYGLSCPDVWQDLPQAGLIRELERIIPLTEGGEIFGPGLADKFDINIENGDLIGPAFDLEDGSYLQMIEYRDGGAAPELAYKIGEFSSERVAVGQAPLTELNRLQDRANLVTGLLIVSLIGNGILFFRRRFGENRPL